MTWSYSGDPSSSSVDLVRFLCGDTDQNDQLLSNEEIQYLISVKGSPYSAAQEACLAIMAKLAREVDYAIGPEKVQASQRFEAYKKMMESLRAARINTNAAPSWDACAGASEPIFDVGMHDNKESLLWTLNLEKG